jgi:hypothetical protein
MELDAGKIGCQFLFLVPYGTVHLASASLADAYFLCFFSSFERTEAQAKEGCERMERQ